MADRYKVITFQLPLSGSPHVADLITTTQSRKTFNSLSRDHVAIKWEGEKARIMYLSTPSLGITRLPRREGDEAESACFQLPLSGSR